MYIQYLSKTRKNFGIGIKSLYKFKRAVELEAGNNYIKEYNSWEKLIFLLNASQCHLQAPTSIETVGD